MTTPQLHYLDSPDTQRGHRLAWWQWGNPDSTHVVVCVHGLIRQGRDFDVLAQTLVKRAAKQGKDLSVVCPDIAGRGKSDWLPDPMDYQMQTHVADMLLLLREMKAQNAQRQFDWVGTSLGGLIALRLLGELNAASDGANDVTIRRLVLNDIGPSIQWEALQRIGSYVGVPGLGFSSIDEGIAYLEGAFGRMGLATDEEWLALNQPMLAQSGDGHWRLHYDPAIAQAFQAMTPEVCEQEESALWAIYEQIRIPTLLIRGSESDLLKADAAWTMTQCGPQAQLLTFADVGHAPTLVSANEVDAVARFLLDD